MRFNAATTFAGLNSLIDCDSARFARTPSATTLPTLESARLTPKSETSTTSRWLSFPVAKSEPTGPTPNARINMNAMMSATNAPSA